MVKHTQTIRWQFADDLFECPWLFRGGWGWWGGGGWGILGNTHISSQRKVYATMEV